MKFKNKPKTRKTFFSGGHWEYLEALCRRHGITNGASHLLRETIRLHADKTAKRIGTK